MHKFICGIVTPVPYYILYADIRTCLLSTDTRILYIYLNILYSILHLQIATFLRTNISYDGQYAYGIVLNKVPKLDANTKKLIREYIRAKTIPKRGVLSNPRPFLTDDKAELQVVRMYTRPVA